MPTSYAKYVLCKGFVSDPLLGKDSFRQAVFLVTPLIFCVTDFVDAIKQNVSN